MQHFRMKVLKKLYIASFVISPAALSQGNTFITQIYLKYQFSNPKYLKPANFFAEIKGFPPP